MKIQKITMILICLVVLSGCGKQVVVNQAGEGEKMKEVVGDTFVVKNEQVEEKKVTDHILNEAKRLSMRSKVGILAYRPKKEYR